MPNIKGDDAGQLQRLRDELRLALAGPLARGGAVETLRGSRRRSDMVGAATRLINTIQDCLTGEVVTEPKVTGPDKPRKKK
jgi:hypothetical protein